MSMKFRARVNLAVPGGMHTRAWWAWRSAWVRVVRRCRCPCTINTAVIILRDALTSRAASRATQMLLAAARHKVFSFWAPSKSLGRIACLSPPRCEELSIFTTRIPHTLKLEMIIRNKDEKIQTLHKGARCGKSEGCAKLKICIFSASGGVWSKWKGMLTASIKPNRWRNENCQLQTTSAPPWTSRGCNSIPASHERCVRLNWHQLPAKLLALALAEGAQLCNPSDLPHD